MSFTCGRYEWNEDLMDLDHYFTCPTGEMQAANNWMHTEVPSLDELADVVGKFNARYLTFPEDVLAAFSGIQSQLHRTYPGGLLFGLPELFFDISLLWDVSYSSITTTRRQPSGKLEGDVSRNKLPSWSWIKLHADNIRFPPDLEFRISEDPFLCGFLEPVTEWFTMESPLALSSGKRRIKSRWFDYKRLGQNAHSPIPDGWTRHHYELEEPKKDFLPKNLPRFWYEHNSDKEEKS